MNQQEQSADRSLWSDSSERKVPFSKDLAGIGLVEQLQNWKVRPDEDKLVARFRVPVTPDVLSQQTQG